MKKILLAIMAVFAFTVNSSAQDKIEIKDVKIPEKGSANLAVNLISQEHSYIAFQFDLKLPAGISAKANASNLTDRATSVSDGWSVAFKQVDAENNIYNCIAYNSDNAAISGTTGTVLNIVLTAGETLSQGYTGIGKIQGAIMSTKEQKYSSAEGEFNIEIIEDRVIFNETDTELPVYTDGALGNIRMNRTLKADKWATLVLPFNLTYVNAKKVFGNDVKYAVFSGVVTTFNDEYTKPESIEIKFTDYNNGAYNKPLAGGTVVLVKPSVDVESFDLDNVTLKSTITNTETGSDDSYGKFVGTFVKTIIPNNGLFINGEKFWYSTGKTNIKAFRGWFDLKAVVDEEFAWSKVHFTVDGEATDIDGIPSYKRVLEGVYDLSGRKIKLEDGDVTKLQKGVYIIDGKKVTIK